MIVEPEFDTKLRELLASLGYSGIKTSALEHEEDEYRGKILVEVEVSSLPLTREDAYSNAKKIREFCDGYNVEHQFLSVLNHPVGAKLGDFVVPFSDWHRAQDDFAVGIVTSVYRREDVTKGISDVIAYGVRHIKGRTDYHFPSLHSSVLLTDDDYGGHPTGFIKVLTREEALSRAKEIVRKGIESIEYFFNKEKERLDSKINEIIEAFTVKEPYTVQSCDKRK